MKLLHGLIVLVLVLVLGTVAIAGWQVSQETSFTGTTFTWWNTNTPARMLYVKAILVRHDTAVSTNQITIYRLDSETNAFAWAATEATANVLTACFTPDGNGEIAVPFGDGFRIIQTVTNKMYIIGDLYKPE